MAGGSRESDEPTQPEPPESGVRLVAGRPWLALSLGEA